jgi:hypothetical protein
MTAPNTSQGARVPTPDFAKKPVEQWTLDDAKEAVRYQATEKAGAEGFDTTRRYLEEHDHWQEGKVLPLGTTDPAVRQAVLDAAKPQFTPVDAIGEVLTNVANALLKSEAAVSFAPKDLPADGEPTEQQTTRSDQMVRLLSGWWDRVRLWEKARDAAKRARAYGRGYLRLWLPAGLLDARSVIDPSAADEEQAETVVDALPSGLSAEDAFRRLQLSAPDPLEAAIYVDSDTQEQVAVFLFRDKEDEDGAELWTVNAQTGDAVVRVVSQDATIQAATYPKIPLAGRLPIAEMEADILITEPVRRQQASLDFGESIVNRTLETAGFPERTITNAEPHGIWTKQKPLGKPLDIDVIGGETWYLAAADRTLGSSITTEVIGLKDDTGTGSFVRQSPGVIKFEPTSPEFAILATEHRKATIYASCHQLHLMPSSTANLAADTIRQLRAPFEADVTNTKAPLEGMLRDILEAAVVWAGAMSSDPIFSGFLDRYRCVVNLHVDTGPPTAAEMTTNSQLAKDGQLSVTTAMSRNGVEDTDAELEAIQSQPAVMADLTLKQAQIIAALVNTGWPDDIIAEIARDGLTDDIIERIKTFAEEQAALPAPPTAPSLFGQPQQPGQPPQPPNQNGGAQQNQQQQQQATVPAGGQ